MQIVKGILTGVYLLVSVVLIILVMVQSKEDAGMSATITGSSSNNFFEQNKGRTKEGKQKKWTIILAVAFVVVGIALSIIYPV
jgi:protein translocase SecG subunit